MKKDHHYFLKISAKIDSSNQREFQQTVQFLFNHLQSECLEKNLSVDLNIINLYHIYFLWVSQDALYRFKSGHEFELLKGALQTLGNSIDTQSGSEIDMRYFEADQFDHNSLSI